MNLNQLIEKGYRVENAKITRVDLSMEDHGCLTLNMVLEGSDFGWGFGGYRLGHGYLRAEKFEGSAKGLEYIMRIMDTVGVSKFSELKGKYIRIAYKYFDGMVDYIGNIIQDKWFSERDFFKSGSGT